MPRPKNKPAASLIDDMLGEASWLISHAQALGDYGRTEDEKVEWARAASCEEEVACLLDAAGRDLEAAIHRVSAGSCHARIGHYNQAVTLLRAALSAKLRDAFRAQVEKLLTSYLAEASKELQRTRKRVKRKMATLTR
jgi:hypothetical protein